MDNIEPRLISIEKDVASIAKSFETMSENQEEFIDSMREVLFGNGKQEGLVAMVSANRKWIEKREWFEKVIIGAMAVQFITLLFIVLQNIP